MAHYAIRLPISIIFTLHTGGLEKLHQKWLQKSMKFFPRQWSFSNDGEVFPTTMKFFFSLRKNFNSVETTSNFKRNVIFSGTVLIIKVWLHLRVWLSFYIWSSQTKTSNNRQKLILPPKSCLLAAVSVENFYKVTFCLSK